VQLLQVQVVREGCREIVLANDVPDAAVHSGLLKVEVVVR